MTATRAPAQPSGFGQTSGFNSKPPSLPTCYQLRVATTPAPLRPLCPAMLGPPLPLPSKSLSYSLPSWHPPSRPRPSLTIGPSRTACLVAGDPCCVHPRLVVVLRPCFSAPPAHSQTYSCAGPQCSASAADPAGRDPADRLSMHSETVWRAPAASARSDNAGA